MALVREEAEASGPITGEGVFLRSPQISDYEDWARLRAESRAFLSPWEPTWPEDDLTRAAYKRRLRRYQQDMQDELALPFFVFRAEDGMLVGACNLSRISRGVLQSASLGYWAGQRYSRRGYTRAAVRALVGFAFDRIGLHRIEAACIPGNEPSRCLLESLGFRLEGYARNYLKIDGLWRDHLLFAILREDALFDPDSGRACESALEADLAEAVGKGLVEPHYQPVRALKTGALVGFEALARWRHPERGLLAASSFVNVAERGGLASALADRMIAGAAAQLAGWRARGADDSLYVAVNVSSGDLDGHAIANAVARARSRHGLPPGVLRLEVTETQAMRDAGAALAALNAAKAAGASLALDDFGAGHSSLARLAQFPFDAVKTDAVFSANLPDDRVSEAVLRSVVGLAKDLGLETVAEGVESEAAARALGRLGFDSVQGHAIGMPAPAADAERALRLPLA
jgi:ribosomal-protein-alanine N-acetyltransferase